MNCKYCGAALPTRGGVCPECGRMIPISQQQEMRQMLDPKWNMYRNKNTAEYKKASNNDTSYQDKRVGKIIVFAILAIIVFIIIAIVKSH
jgi:predicted nucleic acid-binding Zn ribbon protein